jgi:hypothetical protein
MCAHSNCSIKIMRVGLMCGCSQTQGDVGLNYRLLETALVRVTFWRPVIWLIP